MDQHNKQHEHHQTQDQPSSSGPQPAPAGQSLAPQGSQEITQQQEGTVTPAAAPALTGPFVNRLAKILPYMGTSVQDPKMVNQGAGGTGITLTASANYVPLGSNGTGTGADIVLPRSIVAGYIRIKAFGAGTITAILVTCTDGTNTEIICSETCSMALTATTGMTKVIIFETEINPIVFAITLTGGSGGTASIEVAGSTGN